ncbi:5'-nucleotidase SurE [hydrothermal vent metagenome]|uniref:5'-nucleotidase SurE n=1 Tax=hydrothermal vent metagenome TaxID=652676 RepID=A0A3B0R9N9_9ZZZZ
MLPKNPRILLSNDDGIDAPGLALLERVARKFSDDIWVVAPAYEQSAASRALSIRDPLRVNRRDERHIAVYGTPTDSVMMGVLELVEGKRPELILSGINKGQNLAEHITLSGTIAAAIQGMEMGIPSVALSQTYPFTEKGVIHWETAEAHAVPVLEKLFASKWPDDVLLNINFPDCTPNAVTGVQITRMGRRDADLIEIHSRKDPGGREYHWLGFNGRLSKPPKGVDLRAIYENRISVTPLHMDLTHNKTLAALTAAFDA